jgi:hypothetical protein
MHEQFVTQLQQFDSLVRRPDGEHWVIVATRRDEDVVNLIEARACLNGFRISRVDWVDDKGPIRLYSSREK